MGAQFFAKKTSMRKREPNKKTISKSMDKRTVFFAKLNLLIDSENADLTSALTLAIKKKRVKVNLYFSPLNKAKPLPVILVKTKKGEEGIVFQSGMSSGGTKMRVSEYNAQTALALKNLANSYNRDDFVSCVVEKEDALIVTTTYFSEEWFEKYLMEQARILVDARVETLSAYPPFAIDYNAQTILHRNLLSQKITTMNSLNFNEGLSEGDEKEDRILYIELTADKNACELATAVADALKKLTEAI